MTFEERQLIEQAQAGDERAFDVLVARYLKLIYSVAAHYAKNVDDAEDVAQDALVKIWKNLKTFDLDQEFKPWAARITANTALDWLKKKRPVAFSALENADNSWLAESIEDETPRVDRELERLEADAAVRKAVAQLAEEDRMIMHLRYELEMTYREIGEYLGKALDTVKSRHSRALVKVRALLDLR